MSNEENATLYGMSELEKRIYGEQKMDINSILSKENPVSKEDQSSTDESSTVEEPESPVTERVMKIFNIIMEVVEEFGGQLKIVDTKIQKSSADTNEKENEDVGPFEDCNTCYSTYPTSVSL